MKNGRSGGKKVISAKVSVRHHVEAKLDPDECDLLAKARKYAAEENISYQSSQRAIKLKFKREDDLQQEKGNKRYEKFRASQAALVEDQNKPLQELTSIQGNTSAITSKMGNSGNFLTFEVKKELVDDQNNRITGDNADDLVVFGSKEDIAKDVKMCQDANYSAKELKDFFPKVIPALMFDVENMGNASSSKDAIVTPSSDEGPKELMEGNLKVNPKVAEELQQLIKKSISSFEKEIVEEGCQRSCSPCGQDQLELFGPRKTIGDDWNMLRDAKYTMQEIKEASPALIVLAA